jgi:hypothetical protein
VLLPDFIAKVSRFNAMHHSSGNLHRGRYPPPSDRQYNLCRACGHHWDQGTKPTCVCHDTARRRASDSWTVEFTSSIATFDHATVFSTHNAKRWDSPPLRYDQPMIPPVEPPSIYPAPIIGVHHGGAFNDPFTANPTYSVRDAPPPLPPQSGFHPQLAAPTPLRPYPSYTISDETTHADIALFPAMSQPQQTSPMPPPPHLWHNGNHIQAQVLYADPDITEDPYFVDRNRELYVNNGPPISSYVTSPIPAAMTVPPSGVDWRAPAHLNFHNNGSSPYRRWDPK